MTSEAIFDAAEKFSDFVHRQAAIAQLQREIFRRECGDCEAWMTRGCPREGHNNRTGMSNGPSCGALPCSSYAETDASTKLRAKKTQQLIQLQEPQ